MMSEITVKELAKIVGGRWVRGSNRRIRHAVEGRYGARRRQTVLFVDPAKHGRRQHVSLRSRRVVAAVVPPRWKGRVPRRVAVITVPRSRINQAMDRLVLWQRRQSTAHFVVVTGSSGKSTTKEMTGTILSQTMRTFKSPGNYNARGPVRRHILIIHKGHQAVVLEMGMKRSGQLARKVALARPDVGVVTMVGEAHVGNFKGDLDGVARAKQELVDGIVPGGALIVNADDEGTQRLDLDRFSGKIIWFGLGDRADIRGEDLVFSNEGTTFTVNGVRFRIPLWGRHNVYNALAAIAVASHLKVPTEMIQSGLRTVKIPGMRMKTVRGIRSATIINDAYNANPSSMIAGLEVVSRLTEMQTRRRPTVLVLGQMGDLGAYAPTGYQRVGRAVATLNPSLLVTVGKGASQIAATAAEHGVSKRRIRRVDSSKAAARILRRRLPRRALVYIKASRTARFERIFNQLRTRRAKRSRRRR